MAYNLVRLCQITQNEEYAKLLEKQIAFMRAKINGYPAQSSMFLVALLLYEDAMAHITISLKEESGLNQIKDKLPFMANVRVTTENAEYPLLNNQTTFYVCKNHNCLPPSNTLELL